MLFKFENDLENFVYWCNNCGELHHNGEYDIEKIENLPEELQRAYSELWVEYPFGIGCCIAEFNREYGIVFSAEYDSRYAEELKISYEELLNIANEKAQKVAAQYPEYDVIYGKDTTEWSDGSISSVILLFLPWDISQEEFEQIGKDFTDKCYDIKKGKIEKVKEEPEQKNGMRLVYKCRYDGKICDKEIPKMDNQGYIIPPKEYKNPNIHCPGDWEICMSCDRNHMVSGTCCGVLKIIKD